MKTLKNSITDLSKDMEGIKADKADVGKKIDSINSNVDSVKKDLSSQL